MSTPHPKPKPSQILQTQSPSSGHDMHLGAVTPGIPLLNRHQIQPPVARPVRDRELKRAVGSMQRRL